MAEHPNAAMVREGQDAIARGDDSWMRDHLADDVIWHVGGNSKAAGTYQGKDVILGMMGGSSGVTFDLDTHDVLANDDHAVVLGTAKLSAPDGDSVEYRYVNVFHISGDKVTEAWGMAENDAETDAFWDKMAPPS